MSAEPVYYLAPGISESRLQVFLYLLMRDHLPAGMIERLAEEVSPLAPVGHRFRHGPLAAYAAEVARQLSVPER